MSFCDNYWEPSLKSWSAIYAFICMLALFAFQCFANRFILTPKCSLKKLSLYYQWPNHQSRIHSWIHPWFIVTKNLCDFQNDHFRFKNTLFRPKSTLFESNNIRFSVADDFASRKSRLKLQKSTLVWLDSLSGMSRPTTVRSSKSELMM